MTDGFLPSDKVFPPSECLGPKTLDYLDRYVREHPGEFSHFPQGVVAFFSPHSFGNPDAHTHIAGNPPSTEQTKVNVSLFTRYGVFLKALEQQHSVAETVEPVPLSDSVSIQPL